MPPPKSLSRHCLDKTFRSRRHRALLDGQLVPWRSLARIQAQYQATAHELERRNLGVEFERAVRTFDPEVDEEHNGEAGRARSRSLTELLAELEAIINMPPIEFDADIHLHADRDRVRGDQPHDGESPPGSRSAPDGR